MMYKVPNGLLPLYLSELFQINSTVIILGLREREVKVFYYRNLIRNTC